jgi:hypothetical protein
MYINSYSRDSSVSRVTRLRDRRLKDRVWVPDRFTDICVIRKVDTGHLPCSATYPLETLLWQHIQITNLTPRLHQAVWSRKGRGILTLSHRYHGVQLNKHNVYKSRQPQICTRCTKLYHFGVSVSTWWNVHINFPRTTTYTVTD